MLLTDKVAVIYGGGGAIGGAIARAFQREGAEVFLAGRTRSALELVADPDHAYEVDALDEAAVNGIRVVTLRTGGIVESIPAGMPGRDEIAAGLVDAALLPQTATLADVGNVAAFVCSDLARTITDAEVNISCGAIVD